MTKLSERLRKGASSVEYTRLGGVTHDTRCLEAADLLDECETLIVAMRQEIQNLGGSLEGVITADATLAKLRAAQEKAEDLAVAHDKYYREWLAAQEIANE